MRELVLLGLVLSGCGGGEPAAKPLEVALTADAEALSLERIELPAATPFNPQLLVVGDYNRDHALDVVLLSKGAPATARLGLQNGDGKSVTLSSLSGIRKGCVEHALARDFDLDGDDDLALVTCQGVFIYRNTGSAQQAVGFELVTDTGLAGGGHEDQIVAIDADRDGDTDLMVLADPGAPPVGGAFARSRLWSNRAKEDGALRFVEVPGAIVPNPAPTGAHVSAVAVADLSGDGRPDVYGARDGHDLLLVQQPDGKFKDEGDARGLTQFDAESGLVLGDLDADGDADAVTVSPAGLVTIRVNDGSGHFSASALDWPAPLPATGIALADLDGDAHPDLLVASGNPVLRSRALRFTGLVDGVPDYDDVGANDYTLPLPAAAIDTRQDGGQLALALTALLPNQSSYLYLIRYFPRPTVECVTRFTDTEFSAKFGYDNPFGAAIAVARGPLNQISPTPAAKDPPIPIDTFAPGRQVDGFWVPFAGGELTWKLGKRTAVASSVSTPRCAGTDYQPVPSPQIPIGFGEGPDSAGGGGAADFGELGSAVSGLGAGAAMMRPTGGPLGPLPSMSLPFKFIFTAYHQGEDGDFASPDLFASVRINNGPVHWVEIPDGDSPNWEQIHMEVVENVPSDLAFVPVHIELFDRDDLSADDLEVTMDALVNNHTSQISGGYSYTAQPGSSLFFSSIPGAGHTCALSSDGWGACIDAEQSGPPSLNRNQAVCATWKAAFDDSGHGEDSANAAAGVVQELPASFAHAKLELSTANGVAWEGILDRDGCIPLAERPSADLFVTPETRSVDGVEIKLTLTFAMELPGFRYEVLVTEKNGVPTTQPEVLNHKLKPLQGWGQIGAWLIPPVRLTISPALHHDATRVAAVVGQIMRGEDNGIPQDPAHPVVVQTWANKACDVCGLADTCAGSIKAGHSRDKFVVAHEIGHQIQGVTSGLPLSLYMFQKQGGAPTYTCDLSQVLVDPPDAPELCTCNAVAEHNNLHCFQSLETSEVGQVEGFAHFYAAKAFNNPHDNDCTFTYYKQFLSPTCPPGQQCTPRGNLFVVQPPLPRSCTEVIKWRNRHCAVPQFGVESDWLGFYWNVNTSGASKISLPEMLDVYKTACGGNCSSHNTPWVDLENAARTKFGARDPKALQWTNMGNAYGVSTDTAP